MKKILGLVALASLLLFGIFYQAHAAPISWDYTSGVLQPLQSAWGALVKIDHLQATSTSATSTFAYSVQSPCFTTNGINCISGNAGVTSVTGTYPVISSGGSTPAISLAFGTTTSNTWAGTQTFTNQIAAVGGLTSNAQLNLIYSGPAMLMQNTGATTDNKNWVLGAGATDFSIYALNDAGTISGKFISATRSGGTIASVALPSLTGNGFVKTSGGTGTLSVDTTSYQPTGNYITALTGDVTASGPGSVAATLATVNSNVGSFTNANVTVNAKGLVTAASNGTNSTGLSTSSPLSSSNLLVYSTTGAGSAYGIATSTLTAGTGLTGSFTQIGSGGSLALSVPVSTANGGTGTTTWQTGSIPYFDGTRFTENNINLNFDGSHLGIGAINHAQALAVTGNEYISGDLVNVTNITATGAVGIGGAATLSSALTYGGVTLNNAVTGTGNMVLSNSPIFTGNVRSPTLIGGTTNASTLTLSATNNATPATAALTLQVSSGATTAGSPITLTTSGTGIGTTTPFANLSVFTGGNYLAQAASTVFAIGSSTAGTATSTLFSIDSKGHIGVHSTSPTANTCTGFTLTSGGDTAGTATFTGGTSCSITFGTTYATAPICPANETASVTSGAVKVVTSTTGITFSFGTTATGVEWGPCVFPQ